MVERPYSSWLLEWIAIGNVVRLRHGTTTIGRHSSSIIRINHSNASRHHAEITISDDDRTVQIRDLNSSNGVFVNDDLQRNTSKQLSPGDRIGFGVYPNDEILNLEDPIYLLRYTPLICVDRRSVAATTLAAETIKMPSIPAPAVQEFVANNNADTSSSSKAQKLLPQPTIIDVEYINSPQYSKRSNITSPMPCNGKFPTQSSDLVIILSDDQEEKELSGGSTAKNNFTACKNDNLAQSVIVINKQHEGVPLLPQPTDTKILTPPKSTKLEAKVHEPIASSIIKLERVRSVSAEIKNIFGEADEVILDKMKEINPDIFNNLNRKPPKQPLRNKDYISLSSDDDEVEYFGTISEERPLEQLPSSGRMPESTIQALPSKSNERIESPNIFDSSLNNSNENEGYGQQIDLVQNNNKAVDLVLNTKKAVDVVQNTNKAVDLVLNTNKAVDVVQNTNIAVDLVQNTNKTVDLVKNADEAIKLEVDKEYSITQPQLTNRPFSNFETDADYGNEDADEMFSQALLNDMKAELASCDSDNNSCENDNQKNNVITNNIDEPSKTSDSGVTSFCWSNSDNEDFDEELESKVTGWSNKLFSQSSSFPLSQNYDNVYGVDSKNNDNDDDVSDSEYDQLYSGNEAFAGEIFNSLRNKLYGNYDDKEPNTAPKEVEQEIIASKSTNNVESPIFKRYARMATRGLSSSEDEVELTSKPKRQKRKSVQKLQLKDTEKSKYNNSTKEDAVLCTSNEMKALQSKSTELPINYTDVNGVKQDGGKTVSVETVNVYENPIENAKGGDTKHKSIRGPPPVINPPQLPKHRGRKRGVSANATNVHSTHERNIQNDIHTNDLKCKWLQKSSAARREEKAKIVKNKESRKQRLKELADKQNKGKNPAKAIKRSLLLGNASGPAKVKITPVNRGAFLTEEVQKDNKKVFKIPKIDKSPVLKRKVFHHTNSEKGPIKDKIESKTFRSAGDSPSASGSATPSTSASATPSTSASAIPSASAVPSACDIETFSQQLSKADEVNFKGRSSSNIPKTKNDDKSDVKAGTSLERHKKKITFAAMQKNFIESLERKKKLDMLLQSKLATTEIRKADTTMKKKKTVRFNNTPIVHYIERIGNAIRKVDAKDIMPRSSYRDRRKAAQQKYATVDYTDQVITLLLSWSNDWLIKRNPQATTPGEMIFPMPTQFTSYKQYKSIIFPLMKMEFVCMLEREYQSSHKTFKVAMEYATHNKDRIMLITKFNHQGRASEIPRCDLAILEIGGCRCFAYKSANRAGVGSCNTIVFEIIAKDIFNDFLTSIKTITVQPVVDNVRVELGAFNAVYQLEKTSLFNKILNPLELTKYELPIKRKLSYKGFHPLNSIQQSVVLNTYLKITDENIPNITLIQGPPGTGKSCVITNLALQALYGNEVRCLDQKILICAQSNVAVDIIAEKLYDISQRMRPEIKFRVVRYGISEKINPKVAPISLQKLVQQDVLKKFMSSDSNVPMEGRANIRHQILQLEAEIANIKINHIRNTVKEHDLIEKERQLKQLRDIVSRTMNPKDERSISTWYLNNANIVCATLSSCLKLSQYNVDYFDICIIDEATQCTEPCTLLPLKFGINSLILVGDTQQLPATVLSKKAYDYGLGTSLFTRIQRCLTNANLPVNIRRPHCVIQGLKVQYRMHPEICKWPNAYFYKNELSNAEITYSLRSAIVPFSVLNLAYSQNKHCNSGKIVNNMEASFITQLVKTLDAFLPINENSYGVITPYAQHRDMLITSMRSAGLESVLVNTIDSYQGVEMDVVIISNARTNGIGFLSNPQRLNVALTRPKKCLILCGNFKNLESVPVWRSLLNNARERNLFHELSSKCMTDMENSIIEKIKAKY